MRLQVQLVTRQRLNTLRVKRRPNNRAAREADPLQSGAAWRQLRGPRSRSLRLQARLCLRLLPLLYRLPRIGTALMLRLLARPRKLLPHPRAWLANPAR